MSILRKSFYQFRNFFQTSDNFGGVLLLEDIVHREHVLLLDAVVQDLGPELLDSLLFRTATQVGERIILDRVKAECCHYSAI